MLKSLTTFLENNHGNQLDHQLCYIIVLS